MACDLETRAVKRPEQPCALSQHPYSLTNGILTWAWGRLVIDYRCEINTVQNIFQNILH